MYSVLSRYRRVVMHCLGGDQLRKLDLQSCEEIDPSHRAATELQTARIPCHGKLQLHFIQCS